MVDYREVIDWLKGNDLILTNGKCLKPVRQDARNYVQYMRRYGDVADATHYEIGKVHQNGIAVKLHIEAMTPQVIMDDLCPRVEAAKAASRNGLKVAQWNGGPEVSVVPPVNCDEYEKVEDVVKALGKQMEYLMASFEAMLAAAEKLI